MREDLVYLRLRNRYYMNPNGKIYLGDIAQIIAPDTYEDQLKSLFIYQTTTQDKNLVVVDLMDILQRVKVDYPEITIINIGNPEVIVEIITPSMKKQPHFIFIVLVWLLLFIGSGLAIMNFHHDVSMQEVHQRIYYLITGVKKDKPLMLQIPYSFGIGIGMILFFNHIFKKKINEEPSPLEVEMFLYQENLDQFVVSNEKKDKP